MGQDLIKTPAQRRRQKVRKEILSAAERVFAREGGEGLSIRRLADAINYSPAAIYKYFGSKEELVEELKEAFFERLHTHINEVGEHTGPYPMRMREAVAVYIRTAIEKPHHYVAAFTGQTLDVTAAECADPETIEFAETQKGKAFIFISGMVQEGVDRKYFRADLDAVLAAKSIWVSMHGLAMMMAHMPAFPAFSHDETVMSPEEFIEFHADLIIRGLEAGNDRH